MLSIQIIETSDKANDKQIQESISNNHEFEGVLMLADLTMNNNQDLNNHIEYPLAVIMQNEGEKILVRKASVDFQEN